MKKILVVVFVLITLSVNAQISTYLEKGTSGIAPFLGYEIGNSSTGFCAGLNYSYKGTIEAYGAIFVPQLGDIEGLAEGSDNASALCYMIDANWWFLRQSIVPGIEINVALNAGFQYEVYNGLVFPDMEVKDFIVGYVGPNFSVTFNLPNKWIVQPTYMCSYGIGRETEIISSVAGTSEEKTPYNGIVSNFGASLGKKMNNGNSLVFTIIEGLGNQSEYSFYDMSITYVFAFKK